MTRTKAQKHLASTLFNQTILLKQLERYPEAVAKCDDLMTRFDGLADLDCQELVGLAHIQKAYIKSDQGLPDEAVQIYDLVIRKLDSNAEPRLCHLVARAHYSKGISLADELEDLEAATSCFEQAALKFAPLASAESLRRRGDALIRQAHTLNLRLETEAASKLYQSTRDEFEPRIAECPTQVANMWLNHGLLLSDTGQYEEALALQRQLIERFHTHLSEEEAANEHAADVRRNVANAWLNSTVDLANLGRETEKITVCQDLISEFENDEHPQLQAIVARAHFNMARGYEEENQPDEAVKVYQQVEQRFGESSSLQIQEVVAQSLDNLGNRLEERGDAEGAIAAEIRVWRAHRESNDPKLQKQAYMGLANVTRLLPNQADEQRELEGYAEIIDNAPQAGALGMGQAVAMALINRATKRWRWGQHEEAFQDWDSAIERFADSLDEGIEEQVAKALDLKSRALQVLGERDGEKACFEAALAIFRGRGSHAAHKTMLWAYCSLAQFLMDEESNQTAALAVWKEALSNTDLNSCPCFSRYIQQMRIGVKSLEGPDEHQQIETTI